MIELLIEKLHDTRMLTMLFAAIAAVGTVHDAGDAVAGHRFARQADEVGGA